MSELDPQDSRPPEPETAPEQPAPPPENPAPATARRLPADVLTPWGWKQLLLFVAVAFASLVLLTNVMAFGTILWFKVKPGDIKSFVMTSATFLSLRTAIWYVLLIGYLYATVCLGRPWPFWRTIGWRDVRRPGMPRAAGYAMLALGGMVLAVLVELGSLAFRTKAKLPIEALFHDRRGILWLMAVGILLAPVVEETIFRGYLYPVLARGLGVEGGILATGVLFGLMHAPQLWGGWGQIGLLVLVGIVLTYARARTGSVMASWLLHLGYNTFLFAGFFISTGGLRHLPPVS
ncbi:MAG TPA: CPBP family intramembrane glutamic endopeptidase [Patescibacteria group bacterium]|nr:CPBP family intramembrane glutamic endopeptidase [Patescibacteria group bacterium]